MFIIGCIRMIRRKLLLYFCTIINCSDNVMKQVKYVDVKAEKKDREQE